jgi:hypothetical protein
MTRPEKFTYAEDVPRWIRAEIDRTAIRYGLMNWTLDIQMADIGVEDESVGFITLANVFTLVQYRKGSIYIDRGLRRTAANCRALRHELVHVLLGRIDHAMRQWLETAGVKVTARQMDILNRLWRDAEEETVEHLLDLLDRGR